MHFNQYYSDFWDDYTNNSSTFYKVVPVYFLNSYVKDIFIKVAIKYVTVVLHDSVIGSKTEYVVSVFLKDSLIQWNYTVP